jgi:hypothetical protein
MRRQLQIRVCLLCGLLALLTPPSAAAEESRPSTGAAPSSGASRDAAFTARGGLGLGGCDLGFLGLAFDAAATWWLSPTLGIGPRVALTGATAGLLGGRNRTMFVIEPELSLRVGHGSAYWVASAALGPAYFEQRDDPFCLNWNGGGCGGAAPRSGVTVGGSFGFGPVVHLHSIAFAPALRIDAIPQGFTAVLMLSLGGSAWTTTRR